MGIVEYIEREVQTQKTSRHSFPSISRDLDFRFWDKNLNTNRITIDWPYEQNAK